LAAGRGRATGRLAAADLVGLAELLFARPEAAAFEPRVAVTEGFFARA